MFFGMEEELRRSTGIFQFLSGLFIGNDYFAVHVSLSALVLFSLVGIMLIHSYFERTSAPEIFYIAIFAICFSFEAIRLVLPLHSIFNFSSFYMRVALRFLLFARFFSVFSLFAAGVCAAGLEVQKTRNVIFVMVLAALVITLGVPIDVLNWDTSFNIVNGYSSMFTLIELAAFFTAMISFLIAAKTRGSKEYIHVAIGVLLVMVGRNILLNTDNWIGPLPGIALLSIGTVFICSKLHKIHLWL
ncbi:MAG: hypothetical protein FWD22_04195 [Treponema sp.]|nr:hypothetical protein [Treponema sp.]